MDRTSAPNYVLNGGLRQYQDRNLATGTPGTGLVAADRIAIQEELMTIQTAGGQVPNASNFGQVLAALRNLFVVAAQVLNTYPVGASIGTSGSTISVTSGTLTAPCNGYALVHGVVSVTPLADTLTTTGIAASLSGLVVICFEDNGGIDHTWGYLPMTAGQASTFTSSGSQNGASAMSASVIATFVPMP